MNTASENTWLCQPQNTTSAHYHKRAICSYGWKLCSPDSKVLLIHTQSRYCSVIRVLLCEEAFRDPGRDAKVLKLNLGGRANTCSSAPRGEQMRAVNTSTDGTTWGALPVGESHPLHPISEDQRWAAASGIVWFACVSSAAEGSESPDRWDG